MNELDDRPLGKARDRGPDAERLFRTALELVSSGVVLADGDGRIVLANEHVEHQFGYPHGELIGQRMDVLVPNALRMASDTESAAGRRTPGPRFAGVDPDLFGQRRDGSRFPVEITLRQLGTGDGCFVLASVEDVTTQRQQEQAHRDTVTGQRDFERLIADMSAQFINLPPEGVDAAMRTALTRIGEALDLDRATFFHVAEDGLLIDPVSWQSEAVPGSPDPSPAARPFPWALKTLQAGEVVCFSKVDEIPDAVAREGYRNLGIRSAVKVPLSVAGRILGAVGFHSLRRERAWLPNELHMLRVFATAFCNVLARRESDEALRTAHAEVVRLRDHLHAENAFLRAEVRERSGLGNVIGECLAIRQTLELVEQVAATDSTVLLLGETGTGKELFASRIHDLGARRGRAMVRVNCAAIPETLVESELFGREKGAFTGALARQIGRFELANHSTIFLDEIGDLPMQVQVKLLRVLEERSVERLGSGTSIKVDTRIIAATHCNLEQHVADGRFREDLYYRLNVFPIHVPPLRERIDDIPLLVWRFVEQFSRAFGKPIETIPADNLAALKRYSWPGNIRELRNVVERAMIVAQGPRLVVPVPAGAPAATQRSEMLEDVEREHIRRTLETAGWRVRGSGGAAERLGLKPSTLETRMSKLGVKRPAR
jgi:formate hydrogenlyase transcriptional activator